MGKITDRIFSKGFWILAAILLVYFTGGASFIFRNPTILVFVGLILLIMAMSGGKK